ncbi:MAG: mercuric reductase [Alphaproteobacteria bacterium]|nr:mercuric reductase [Alphaproteobacteria bacterium]
MTNNSNRPDVAGTASALFTLGGIGAAFGLAACCALPMALASFGLGTAWLAGIALFAASHRPVFLIVAGIGLIGGAGLLGWYRHRVPATLRWLTAIGLLVGAVLLYYGFTYA